MDRYGLTDAYATIIGYIGAFAIVFLISILVYILAKKIFIKMVIGQIKKSKFKWDDTLLNRKFFDRMITLMPLLIVHSGSTYLGIFSEPVKFIAFMLILVQIARIAGCFLESVNDIYSRFEVSREKPIKGFLQVIKIIIYVLVGILILANLMGTNPYVMLSGLGAVAAIFSFIFKDTILGLLAGVLLSVNDMLRIGDWIEMPKYGANGDVMDITMNTVKVRNFDMTITTVPAYALISDSFKNWRGIAQIGGRRIMRSVYIDIYSVKFCTMDELVRFKEIEMIRGPIDTKIDEISAGKENDITNLGVFRMYLEEYLDRHPSIHKEITHMVRELTPTEKGIPLEVYAFTNDIGWESYENTQSEIFEHIVAMTEKFGLTLYQQPSGLDVKKLHRKFE
ncbi:mechanosensitive ion channel family protein [Alkalibacter mobilis]|uniref:mechanosensitive ion channel family protein n=1 Tax=Alkalibacter mobilis TaxID=2787712 RepID=UPI0018A0070B|nr:mechanosensitive ion channel family protein [Alkalibacter mobilis]